MVSMPALHAAGRDSTPAQTRHFYSYIRFKSLALNFRDLCISVSLGGDTKSRQSVAVISIWRLATKYLELENPAAL